MIDWSAQICFLQVYKLLFIAFTYICFVLPAFLQFCNTNKLIENKSPILLAVSGGVDSVVMAHLFYYANIPFAVAHCNFKLRSEESDADELFVKQLCERYNAPFHVQHFDTQNYAQQEKMGIQEAARVLRYRWFLTLLQKYHYQSVATAHHQDDAIETFFINLLRGTGIKGLRGIQPKNAQIIRPLLIFSKIEIRDYALQNRLQYREDSSNLKDDYLRNKIRHQLIPMLEELKPTSAAAIVRTMRYLTTAEQIIQQKLDEEKSKYLKQETSQLIVNLNELKDNPLSSAYLLEWLSPFGFNFPQVHSILACSNQSGKVFLAEKYQLIVNRGEAIMELISVPNLVNEKIEKQQSKLSVHVYELTFEIIRNSSTYEWKKQKHTAELDLEKLQFPLQLRNWKDGDKFIPFGMKGFKKVSDYLIDKKTPLTEKKKQLVLVSGMDIVWLVGYRIDERYKIDSSTQNIFLVQCQAKHNFE
jgi:tRNA(Ile)-lysidine synthase